MGHSFDLEQLLIGDFVVAFLNHVEGYFLHDLSLCSRIL